MIFVKLKTLFNVLKQKKTKEEIRIVKQYIPTSNDLEKFIYNWNIQNPIDKWYRNKYNLRFNSPEHRVLSFIDMALEYAEDRLFEYKESNNYKPGTGNFLKERKQEIPNDEQMIEVFMNQDLSQFDEK